MTQLSLLPDDTKPPPRRPVEPIVREALIEGNYRWWLKRAWGPGPAIAWVGLNPSTADGKRDDPTMSREIGFSFRWGFGSLVKLNLYPFIAANPAAMREWRSGWMTNPGLHGDAREAWIGNMHRAGDEIGRCQTVIAAWGEGAEDDHRDAFMEIVTDLVGRPIEWQCLARTASGAPRHTLARGTHRIPDDATPSLWRSTRPLVL